MHVLILSDNVNIEYVNISAANSTAHIGTAFKDALACIFHIGLESAKQILAATTQMAVKNIVRPIS